MNAAAHLRRGFAVAALAAAWGAAPAQTVTFSGSMGSKALLVIDGAPRAVAVGGAHQGVKLVSMDGGDAVVEIGGKRVPLQLGAPVNLGATASAAGGTQIVLTAGSGGHFVTSGAINGKSVQFVVDTGATAVALSQDQAARIGLDYKKGRRGMAHSANGTVPVHAVRLASVRVGDVTVYDVEAMVVPAAMPMVLLGNSFLTRFQMKRENDRLTLDRRY